MIIAVPYESKMVYQHFGKTQTFKIYEVNRDKITREELFPTDGQGHSELIDVLKQKNVSIVICGGIGSGAQELLIKNDIQFFGGVVGKADTAVTDYLLEKLNYDSNVKCNHHQEDGHTCGEHSNSCGHH